MRNNFPLLVASALLAMLLAGCAEQKLRTLPPSLSVNLSSLSTCQRVLQNVPFPVATPSTAAINAFLADEAALKVARFEIKQAKRCIAYVQTLYARAK